MTKWYNSLGFQLTTSFLVLITSITLLTYFYTYYSATIAMTQDAREDTAEFARFAASQITPEISERLLSLKPGDESSQEFKSLASIFLKMRDNSNLLINFYVVKRDGEKIVFVLDDWELINPNDSAKIGEEYVDYEPILLDGFYSPTASKDIYVDKWGATMSGYAPIKDNYGGTVAVLGVDINVNEVKERQNFVQNIFYLVLFMSVLGAGLIINYFSQNLIRDLNFLTLAAKEISRGNIQVVLPELKNKNEIGELNEAMKSALAGIKFLLEKIDKDADKKR